jgi:dienelactone hydrolase
MIRYRKVLAVSAILWGAIFSLWTPARAQTVRVEFHGLQTTTLTDEQFLNGVKEGRPTTIAGELRVPGAGTGRLPAVVFLHGSGGIRPTPDSWSQEFLGMGIATFVMDSFAGRGIVNTNSGNQAELGRLAMIIDAYRALDLLARHPRIDPERIALMGFSRGGQSALYASVRRFQRMHGTPSREYAAYIPFYAACNTTFKEDTDVADRPIRIHHGLADDYVPVAPCRPYVARLRAAGKNVTLTEYPNAHHAFDSPTFKTPTKRPQSETTRNCTLQEESMGRLINTRTGQLFTYKDPCVEFGPTVGYDAEAHAASVKAVKAFLASTFRLQ